MKIIDDRTNLEITNPDLRKGRLSAPTLWASPEKYETIDNVTKFALYDSDYEEVKFYHRYTEEDYANMAEAERQQAKQEMMDSLPDAVADLAEVVSDNSIDMADVMDAIAELAGIVSNLVEGE